MRFAHVVASFRHCSNKPINLGLVGLLLSIVVVYKLKTLPIWFKQTTKYLSYLWVLFVPAGTIIGVVQIKRLNAKNA